jgi:hypothetical protein
MELEGLAEGQLQNLLRPRGEGDVRSRGALPRPDDLLDIGPDDVQAEAGIFQNGRREPFALSQQSEKHVLGADEVVV